MQLISAGIWLKQNREDAITPHAAMKTVVNLTWDRRGFPQLYKHAQMLVDSGEVDTHAKVGSKIPYTTIDNSSDTLLVYKIQRDKNEGRRIYTDRETCIDR